LQIEELTIEIVARCDRRSALDGWISTYSL